MSRKIIQSKEDPFYASYSNNHNSKNQSDQEEEMFHSITPQKSVCQNTMQTLETMVTPMAFKCLMLDSDRNPQYSEGETNRILMIHTDSSQNGEVLNKSKESPRDQENDQGNEGAQKEMVDQIQESCLQLIENKKVP